MGKIVMGYWDCPYCGSKGIRGDQAACPSCGRGRGDVKFYMKDHADGQVMREEDLHRVEYVDAQKEQTINRNPDWYCSFCNTLNSDDAKFCTNCGASRESSESNYFEMHKKKEAQAQARSEETAVPSRTAPSMRPLLLVLVAIAAAVGLFMFMNGNVTSNSNLVSALSWQRTIGVEQNQMFQESGWSLPEGAEMTGSRQEIHHYDSVLDHYESVEVERSREVFDHYDTYYTHEDMGNGYFEEVSHQEPVYRTEYYTETVSEPVYVSVPRYQTKYSYNIWRWVHVRDVTSKGSDQNPYWPEVTYASDEREGDRREDYRFTVEESSRKETVTHTYRIAYEDWQRLRLGGSISITANRMGTSSYISDDKGNKICDIYPVN